MKQTALQAMLEVEESRLSKNAILHFLQNANVVVAHEFDHAFQVALTAVESAAKAGIRGNELQDLFIAGIFHDFVRSEKEVTDATGPFLSAEEAENFCKENNIANSRAESIKQAIINPANNKLGRHLEFADSAEIMRADRILSFAKKHNQLKEMPASKVERIYAAKFDEKTARLPPSLRRRLDSIARRTIGNKASAVQLGRLSLTDKGISTETQTKNLPGNELAQRTRQNFRTLSMLAIQHSYSDPEFSRQIMAQLARNHALGANPERIAYLKSIINTASRATILPSVLSRRLSQHHNRKMKQYFKTSHSLK